METQKIDDAPKQTIQESLNMASKAGEVAKTGLSSSLPVDAPLKAYQAEERACMLGEEEDKATS